MPQALVVDAVTATAHCVGQRWKVSDEVQLAHLVALVAMGQATRAATIIQTLAPATPGFTNSALINEAIKTLTVQDRDASARTGFPRWQRDGFIFEAISWIAARQELGANGVLKDPHTSATSQGIDGLFLEIDPLSKEVLKACIFEDKCTEDPRPTFLGKVLPAFKDRHLNQRSAELVAAAASLIKSTGADDAIASQSSARVLDLAFRQYRAAFALTVDYDSDAEREKLFSRYEELDRISPNQRIAASFIADSNSIREWLEQFAEQAITYLKSL